MRRILLNLAENADLFGGEVPAKLRQPWHLTTPDMAAMDQDATLTLSTVGSRLATVFGLSCSHCPYSTRQQVLVPARCLDDAVVDSMESRFHSVLLPSLSALVFLCYLFELTLLFLLDLFQSVCL